MSPALDQDSETAVCRGHRIRTIQCSRKALLSGLGWAGLGSISVPGGEDGECLGQVYRVQLKCLQSLSMFAKEFPRAHVGCAEKDVEAGPRDLH